MPQQLIVVAKASVMFGGLAEQLAQWFGWNPNATQNALMTITVGAICATCCALVGSFLVLRRMSLLGDALSHSVLAGIAGAYLVTGRVDPLPMLVGALIAGILTAVLTQFIHQNADVPEDSSIGIVFTSLFAFGVVVVSQAKSVHLDLDCVLLGDLENVPMHLTRIGDWIVPDALKKLVPALGLTLIFLAVFRKELRLTSFDPTLAVTIGISASVMHYLLTTMVAVVTVSAMDVVGLLVVALLIVPPTAARLLTQRLSTMLWLAVAISITSTTLGYLLALYWESSASGLTAVVAGGCLVLAILLSPHDGVLGRALRTIRLRTRICAEDVLAGLFRAQERSEQPEQRVTMTSDECRELAGNGWLANAAMKWLVTRKFIAGQASCTLTDRGHAYARSLVRSHRLWESYLSQNFNLAEDHLHNPAHEMEHYIGPEIQQQITEELAEPGEDPHGRAIPNVDDAN